jgi:glycogen operon protein
MLLYGDEMGRTQKGNNNAYCQDNEISWVDWDLRDENLALLGFTRRLMELRAAHPVFRRRKWFQGREIHGSGVEDIGWFRPDGLEMNDDEWDSGFGRSIGVFLNGEEIPSPDARGGPVTDDSFLLLFNAHWGQVDFTVPKGGWGDEWKLEIDTATALLEDRPCYAAGEKLPVEARSIKVLRRTGS